MVHGLYRPWMRAPRPMMMNKTVIVNQQPHCHHSGGNGSFWGGFLGGLLGGGLFSQGGLFSGMFGFGGMPMMGGGMYTGMPMMQSYANPYGYLNQVPGNQPAQQTNTTTNTMTTLEKLASDCSCKVIDNGDGTYTAYKTGEDGGEIATGTYEEVRDAMLGTATPSKRAESDAEEMAAIKKQSEMQGQLTKAKEEAEKFNKNADVIAAGASITVIDDPEDANFAQYQITLKDGTTKVVRDITSAYAELGIQQPGNEEVDDDGNDPARPPSNTPSNNSSGRSGLPSGWERVDANTTAFGYKTDALLGGEDYKDCKNADAILQHHLNTIGGKYNTPMDPQQLVAQIVKNNKSVFNADGTVREDADWSKLDLPNKQWLIENSYLSENTNSAASNTISSISTQNMSPDPIIGGWSGII